MTEMNIRTMIENGKFWVPEPKKAGIIKIYGAMTLDDFDTIFGFNEKMGGIYDNCWATMMHCMNVTEGNLYSQFAKLEQSSGIERMVLEDLFNIVSNLIRSRIGEKGTWYPDMEEP